MIGKPVLRCGPLVRYVDHQNAVIWFELDRDCEIELEVAMELPSGTAAPMLIRTRPVQIHDGFYVWVPCSLLLPDSWYQYEIYCIDQSTRWRLWPDSKLTGTFLASVFRTFPLVPIEPVRICFGSCRVGIPPGDQNGFNEDPDALRILAEELVHTVNFRQHRWPRLFLFTGDQIYGDSPLSSALETCFKARDRSSTTGMLKCATCGKCICSANPQNTAIPPSPANFEEYAMIYRESWTSSPMVRWALSCIPSFMIYDDHEIIDDWNISKEWVDKSNTPRWRQKISGGLLAYWIYQGAGNLAPRQWLGDSRMRQLVSPTSGIAHVATPEMDILFDRLVRKSTRASWQYFVDVAGTRLVVGDTRMSRKLTGQRLLMDDETWEKFVWMAKQTRGGKIVLVVPGPVLVPHPMHDLLSRAAESIEGDPPSGIGAIIGGIVGGLIAGPPGAVLGVFAGAAGGELLIDRFMPALLEFADAELWAAFPSSFNRMLTLLEDLADGRGTTRKSFIGLIAGDVHHSNVIRVDLLKTQRQSSVLHFTMSPIRKSISPDDQDTLRMLDGSTWYIDLARAIERPSFVDKQMNRIEWYPVRLDGTRPEASALNEWDYFGRFLGFLDVESHAVSYRYRAAKSGMGRLIDLGGARVITIR
jgi:hypothetical protein